jgi:hypothetical protein
MEYYYGQPDEKDYLTVSKPLSKEELTPFLEEKQLLINGNLNDPVQLPPKMKARIIDSLYKNPAKLEAACDSNNWKNLFVLITALGATYRCTSYIKVENNNDFTLLFTEGGINYRPLHEVFAYDQIVCQVNEHKVRRNKPAKVDLVSFVSKDLDKSPEIRNIYMDHEHCAYPLDKQKVLKYQKADAYYARNIQIKKTEEF